MAKFEQQVDVLLIDDEKHFTELAENYLGKSKNNLNLETMETAEKAIDLIDKFDIIVSDYRLPGMDGIDLLKKVREEGSDKPFIVFTGRGRENVAMKALNLGADSYLQKGGDPRTQFAVLENTINKVLDHWVSKKRFEDLFKSTDDLILKVNSEGKILSVNPALAEFLGKKVDEIEGKTLKKVFPGKVAEKRLQVGKKAIEVKETKVLEDQVGEKHFYNIFVPVDRLGEKDT